MGAVELDGGGSGSGREGGKRGERNSPSTALGLENPLDRRPTAAAVGAGAALEADLVDARSPFSGQLADFAVRDSLALADDHTLLIVPSLKSIIKFLLK